MCWEAQTRLSLGQTCEARCHSCLTPSGDSPSSLRRSSPPRPSTQRRWRSAGRRCSASGSWRRSCTGGGPRIQDRGAADQSGGCWGRAVPCDSTAIYPCSHPLVCLPSSLPPHDLFPCQEPFWSLAVCGRLDHTAPETALFTIRNLLPSPNLHSPHRGLRLCQGTPAGTFSAQPAGPLRPHALLRKSFQGCSCFIDAC